MNEFDNKTILITGSGKGLGSAIAIEAAKHGLNVVVHYYKDEENAESVFEEIKAIGSKCIFVKADLGKQEEIDYLFNEIEKQFGGVDILVNNAAMQYQLSFDKYELNQMKRIFDVNLGGYQSVAKKAIPYMKKKNWGRIINISSVHAKRPTNFDPGYSMSKGAIKMLTRELAIELAPYHITVNAIELGYVDVGVKSGNPADIFPEDWQVNYPPVFNLRKLPVWDRLISQEEVGKTVMFFASNDARSITGSSIRLDDGATLL